MIKSCFKFLALSFLGYVLGINQSFAQDRVIVKLDGNRKPILNENFGTHKFTQILTTAPDSTSISKVYDLKNRLLSVSREKFNPELGYNEAKILSYDTLQNLISNEIKNVDNGSFIRVFLESGLAVSRLEYMVHSGYQFFLGDSETPMIQSETDPMVEQPNFELSEYTSFLARNLKYPTQAREMKKTGTVMLVLEFESNGEDYVDTCPDCQDIYPSLVEEARRVARLFKPTFAPPIDKYGKKTSFKVRMPIRFRLS